MNHFDFLHGDWDVANRRLTEPLPGGAGNIDTIALPALGCQGATPHLYGQERKQRAIHWAGSRRGRLDPPRVGSCTGDRGEFHGDDAYGGRAIRVHCVRLRLGHDTALWKQEFSADDGRNWDCNRVIDLNTVRGAEA